MSPPFSMKAIRTPGLRSKSLSATRMAAKSRTRRCFMSMLMTLAYWSTASPVPFDVSDLPHSSATARVTLDVTVLEARVRSDHDACLGNSRPERVEPRIGG